MDDLDKYINERKEKDAGFKKIWEDEEIKREVVKTLLEMRINQGLTQKELAEKLETSQSSIARLERGKGNPTLNFLVKLGRVFNKRLELHFT